MPKGQYSDEKILLIASYREEYDKKALKKIKKYILKIDPDRIVISKIIEEDSTPELVDATVGMEKKKDFLETVREEKKNQANEYAESLIKLVESIDIPTEVRLRKTEEISDEIIDDYKKIGVDYVIIHSSTKGPISRALGGSTAKRVKKKLPDKSVISVD
ncbi:MAG: universal stress protein [Candidatus Saliniplasma sp.]